MYMRSQTAFWGVLNNLWMIVSICLHWARFDVRTCLRDTRTWISVICHQTTLQRVGSWGRACCKFGHFWLAVLRTVCEVCLCEPSLFFLLIIEPALPSTTSSTPTVTSTSTASDSSTTTLTHTHIPTVRPTTSSATNQASHSATTTTSVSNVTTASVYYNNTGDKTVWIYYSMASCMLAIQDMFVRLTAYINMVGWFGGFLNHHW